MHVVYGFGENQTYHRYSFLKEFRIWLSRKLKITLQLFSGRFGLILLPYQVKKIINKSTNK